jgi:hypothetical protein
VPTERCAAVLITEVTPPNLPATRQPGPLPVRSREARWRTPTLGPAHPLPGEGPRLWPASGGPLLARFVPPPRS